MIRKFVIERSKISKNIYLRVKTTKKNASVASERAVLKALGLRVVIKFVLSNCKRERADLSAATNEADAF